jgi:hypothetical protein
MTCLGGVKRRGSDWLEAWDACVSVAWTTDESMFILIDDVRSGATVWLILLEYPRRLHNALEIALSQNTESIH